jgi:hypothetical protein
LHLVRDGDVGVQIGITGSGVAVGERRGDEPADVDLPDSVSSLSGKQCVAFDEVQCILHGSLVGLLDPGSDAWEATAHNVDTDFTGEKVRS